MICVRKRKSDRAKARPYFFTEVLVVLKSVFCVKMMSCFFF